MPAEGGGHPDWSPTDGAFGRSVLAVNFVADAGKLMLESSTSVSEVIDRLRQFLPSVGLDGCQLDATMSSLIISYWQPGQAMPITTMRQVDVTTPRLERLAAADALLDSVQSGSLPLDDAVAELRRVEEAAPPNRWRTNVAFLVSVVGWVIFVDGLDLTTMMVALVATALAFPVEHLVHRLRMPMLAVTFLVAAIIAGIPNLVAAAGVTLLVGPAVVGALYYHLPGRAFVSSVIDGLANAPLSSISRGIQALATAGFLALGMLAGSSIGAGLGLTYNPDEASTPLAASIAGSALGVLGLAAAWAMPRRQLLPTVLIAVAGWFAASLLTLALPTARDWLAYAIAAGLVGVAGALASTLQGSAASVYTGVAILPLVPGLALYTGMLEIAQGDTSAAASALGDAGVISLAVAIGVAIGLGLGRDVMAVGSRVRTLWNRPN